MKQKLLDFYFEVAKNWESWHVMDQRNVFEWFKMDASQGIKDLTDISFDEKILTYVQQLEDYNKEMDDFKKFEKWYSSDAQNKSPENGKVLHAKRNVTIEKFRGLMDVINPAKDTLEKQLLDMKILK